MIYAILSIVAVHGLASDSRRGWSAQGVCWLTEFLHHDLDNDGHRHRLMTFQHDSRWGSYSSEMSFDAIAENLLDELREKRRTPEVVGNPLPFNRIMASP
ncbi:hypothetical protein K440DRAFT_426046 [Wilcoxina mikolae CBS 423.85]|nr:hypothetical protein K440DRAFT_426046 [Wilcoxina mikolae CBS 423.85]